MSVLVSRLSLRNYRSIGSCDLRLGALSFLVGPNGSGKSNCVDSLRFVAESLRTSLDHALRDRGGIQEVRRRSGGHPNSFSVSLDLRFPDGGEGSYGFRVAARDSGAFEVAEETCVVKPAGLGLSDRRFSVRAGTVTETSEAILPPVMPDRLLLVAAGGLPAFREVYDLLAAMEVYNLNPREIGAMQRPDPGLLLRRDGGNAASVFRALSEDSRGTIIDLLRRVTPDITCVEPRPLGGMETLEFRQQVEGQRHPWTFPAASMSDGTLRAFGVLLAMNQAQDTGRAPSVLGLEEPEMALHPAATAVLLAALRQASRTRQVVVTSHSPDLLDDGDIPDDALFAVEKRDGVTRIGTISEAGRSLLRDRLFTAGELLRMNQIALGVRDPAAGTSDTQQELFSHSGE